MPGDSRDDLHSTPQGLSPESEPIEPGPGSRRPVRRSRGVTENRADFVLILGLLSLFCCWPLGLIPWILGASDLKRIREGSMSAKGRGTLQVGMVLGAISVVVFACVVALAIFAVPPMKQGFRDFAENAKENLKDSFKRTPLTGEKKPYVGEWAGNQGSTLKIYPNSVVDYRSERDGGSKSIKGGVLQIREDVLHIKFLVFSISFNIDKPPHQEDGTWRMTLDGEEFTKKWELKSPTPNKRSDPEELDV